MCSVFGKARRDSVWLCVTVPAFTMSQLSLRCWRRFLRVAVLRQSEPWQDSAVRFSRHLGWALSQVFDTYHHQSVVVLEVGATLHMSVQRILCVDTALRSRVAFAVDALCAQLPALSHVSPLSTLLLLTPGAICVVGA